MARNIDPVILDSFLRNVVGNKFFSVTFVKKDGTERTIARARLNVTSRMANNEKSDAARATLARNSLIPVVDLDAAEGKGWRSFKSDSVVAIKCGGETITGA